MSIEFIARANAIVQNLEEQGLTGTATAMGQVVADYERSARESQSAIPLNEQFRLVSRS
ncbi:MAG: hypothetical protein ABJI96_11890 [Paracoccaceae bacterium]